MKLPSLIIAVVFIGAGLAYAQEDVAETTARPAIDATPIVETPITEADREHWAFRPITRPNLPAVEDRSWSKSAVDAFILARLETSGLRPAGEAASQGQLRRLSLDIIGLPPSPEEVAAFEADRAPDAYERVVDRLLASPGYGERWAQHWLDLARFAETDGFEHDKVRPQAWKYRDWVIAALNADLPYDDFIRQQIAGDLGSGFKVQGSENQSKSEIPKSKITSQPAAAVPTMFCLAGPDMPDINDQVERRHNLLNELTATVGSVLLGLQMGCAQCHDHKYDPVSQGDFYRLRAVFESAVPSLKRDVPYNLLAQHNDAPTGRFWIRGDHRRPGLEVQPGFPRVAVGATGGLTSSARGSTAARGAFAEWLFAFDNPLTARVIVNRLWQHHFGRGIFDTPSDVGLINAGPSHLELLDWLAVELRHGEWGLKRMHRLMLNSASYRQVNRRRLDGEALRDAMLTAAGLLSRDRGGPGVMPPLPPELVGTLLKGQWQASPDEADHYRRSIYVFARRNLRYPIFEAFDRPDANASCPVRNRSTTAPQSLVLLNSEFSLLAARHVAGRVLGERTEDRGQRTEDRDAAAAQIERLYLLTLARRPTEPETRMLASFLAGQRQRLAAEARPAAELALPAGFAEGSDPYAAAALVDACLALLNASEYLYVD